MERGVRLTIAYDGSDFAGFQRQPAQRTVQGVLELALARISQQPVQSRGCSRTDSGVHAEAQVVAFTTYRELTPERWVLALNRYLPPDVAVHDAAPCPPDYDPRFDAAEKTYRYLLYLGFGRHPLLRTQAWHLRRDVRRHAAPPSPGEAAPSPGERSAQLDLAAMQRAAAVMLGTHDFRAFRAADDTREKTERTLRRVDVLPAFRDQRQLLAVEVTGNGFMKHMVRILVGTLVSVGRGRLRAEDVERLLQPGAARSQWSETAPAHGLSLIDVKLGRLLDPASR
jgi:tRNA pseudouridine38-40 synthase